MQTIHKLSDDVISQITAGEVIERPAYVVKELIDNAIDAQATRITIELSESISERISVADDGIGMSAEDIKLASLVHTTSKILSGDDLITVASLGFRGEALASMRAVATLTIYSREHASELGTIFAASEDKVHVAGMPKGTRVVIERIFDNVPGRKRTLRSTQTERRLIVEIISGYALAYPDVHFILKTQDKILFEAHEATLFERYRSLSGETDGNWILPVSFEDSYLTLSGFIARPDRRSQSTRDQYVIINGRPVRDRLISSAFKEAYGTLLPKDLYPRGVLCLQIPVQLIDVNVHPRKEEISFVNREHLYDSLLIAIRETLSDHNLTFQNTSWGLQTPKMGMKSPSITQSILGTALKEMLQAKPPTSEFFNWQTLTQWHQTYISVETKDGVILFDQHAVHERILYEAYLDKFESVTKSSIPQKLDEPIELSLSLSDALILDEYHDYFLQLGFEIQKSGKQRYMVVTVPELFRDRHPAQIIKECLTDLAGDSPIHSIDTLTHKLLTYLACRSAIQAGDSLQSERMRQIIEELQLTKNKYTCPHGRPTMIEMKKRDLDVLFKRA